MTTTIKKPGGRSWSVDHLSVDMCMAFEGGVLYKYSNICSRLVQNQERTVHVASPMTAVIPADTDLLRISEKASAVVILQDQARKLDDMSRERFAQTPKPGNDEVFEGHLGTPKRSFGRFDQSITAPSAPTPPPLNTLECRLY